MRVKVKNFGPIENVDIEPSDLTVIIGQNNIGKSYLAQLYYTLLDCSRRSIRSNVPFVSATYEIDETPFGFYSPSKSRKEQLTEIAGEIKKGEVTNDQILQRITEMVVNEFAQRLQFSLRLSLEQSFGVKLSKLVNVNTNKATIGWDISKFVSAHAQISKRGTLKVKLSISRQGKNLTKPVLESKLFGQVRKLRTHKLLHLARIYREVQRSIFYSRESRILWRHRAYYIPAGRGGLLESYETVVGGLVALSPLAPVRGLSMPPLPGMASQFYAVLLRLRGVKGPMSRVVTEAFRELLEGDILLRKAKGRPKSRMIYKYTIGAKSGSTNIIHAASMIKEITPIFLIVQELIEQGDSLLIEEPESHLHPGAQIRFAYIISNLVRSGVNAFVTTHSDIFLRSVGHLAFESRLKEDLGDKKALNLAVYWLKENKSGSISEPLKIPRRGIIEDIPTFDKIVDDLYEEEQLLQKKSREE